MSKSELEQVLKPGAVKPSEVKKNTAQRIKDWEKLEKKVEELKKDVSYWQNTAERYLKQLELVNVKLMNYELGNSPQTQDQGTQTDLKEKNINALLKQRDDIIRCCLVLRRKPPQQPKNNILLSKLNKWSQKKIKVITKNWE